MCLFIACCSLGSLGIHSYRTCKIRSRQRKQKGSTDNLGSKTRVDVAVFECLVCFITPPFWAFSYIISYCPVHIASRKGHNGRMQYQENTGRVGRPVFRIYMLVNQ